MDLDSGLAQELKIVALAEKISLKKAIHGAVKDYVEKKKVQKKANFEEIWRRMQEISRMGKKGVNLTEWLERDRETRHENPYL